MAQSRTRTDRHRRIRQTIMGTPERPRLSVYRGTKHLYLQLIDDTQGRTLLGISDSSLGLKEPGLTRAQKLGQEIARRALAEKISAVVFDRGGFRYHGQVKAVADSLRAAGIKL